MNRILLVDATEELRPLADELEEAGYSVLACAAAEIGGHFAGEASPDAVIINLTHQPDDSVVRDLLASDLLPDRTVTLALLAPGQAETLDCTLDVDDFLLWPAATVELLARLRRALWRRTGVDSDNAVRFGELVIDIDSYQVFVGGHPVDLTYKEYELLRFLATYPNRVFTRETLLNRVWGYDFYGGARTVDVHVRRLRSKLENASHSFIETVRNVGYRFNSSSQ